MSAAIVKGDYDAVFFYSLTYDEYKWVLKIPKGKVVIWWMWGMDVYLPTRGLHPLIDVQLHKPHTIQLLKDLRGGMWRTIKDLIKEMASKSAVRLRKDVIRRIDYFQPVLPIEYKMMSSSEGFHAKEFYYPSSFFRIDDITYEQRLSDGNIILGHSQSPADNHIDAWADIRDHIPAKRKVIIPISYLGNMDYAERLCKEIYSERHELIFLKDFMPKEDYFKLMGKCTYAVYGMIRQQAMANVYYCLMHGIKVFLYKDSVVYKYLKDSGYVVYAIEEIDEKSFVTPLSRQENEQNAKILKWEANYRNTISRKCFEEILQARQ